MTALAKLLTSFKSLDIKLTIDDDDKLVVRGNKANLTPDLIGRINANKTELVGLLKSAKSGGQKITPQMLPLVKLTQQDIDYIVAHVPGGVANIQDIYPLGPLQQAILFHHMMEHEGGDPYVMPMLFKANTQAAFERFIKGLQFVMNRHDILRTLVLWASLPEAVQVVLREVSLSVQWIDTPTDEAPLSFMERLCAPELQNMALDQAPLVKVQVTKGAESEEHFVLIQFHHMVSDHVGIDIIQQELAAFERGDTAGLATPMPYREFIAHTLHLAEQYDAGAYFKATLGDITRSCLPFGLNDIQGDGSRIIERREALPEAVSEQLRAAAKQARVSPAVLFHGAWGLLLSGFSATEDVVFGTVVSGRLQGTSGAAHTVGVFMNTLPLRVRTHDGDGTVSELVAQVQRTLAELLPYEQASLAAAQRATSIVGDTPLFSGMLNYRHSALGEAIESDVFLVAGQERSNYPVSLLVDDLGQSFAVSVQLDSAVDAVQVMQCTQALIAKLSEALLHSPEMP
ncbi:condensation domain-containing protein, partial [Rheinheimera soli]